MWLVCQDMEGQLFVQSKIEREHELLFCVLCDWGIYTPSGLKHPKQPQEKNIL